MRIFPSFERTLEYASHLYSSGAQLLSVHGRTREAKGQFAGLASWPKISTVREALGANVPVYANGGMPSSEEIAGCLDETGADGVMSAEGNLYNPLIFSPQNAQFGRDYFAVLPPTMQAALAACNDQLVGTSSLSPAYAPATFVASQYLAIVLTLPSTETSLSAIKGHLFKLFRPIWAAGKHLDLREDLGKCGGGREKITYHERVGRYQAVVDLMLQRIQVRLSFFSNVRETDDRVFARPMSLMDHYHQTRTDCSRTRRSFESLLASSRIPTLNPISESRLPSPRRLPLPPKRLSLPLRMWRLL